MTRTHPWPTPPGENPPTPLDRRAIIGRGYRALALRFAEHLGDDAVAEVHKLDTAALRFGEPWVVEDIDSGAARITRAEFAALAGVRPARVSRWSTAPPSWGQCPPRGADGKYDRAAVEDFLHARDTHGVYRPPDWPPRDLIDRVTQPFSESENAA